VFASRLYVVCDADVCARAGWTIGDFVSACFDGGARTVQLRAKSMPGRPFLEAVRDMVARAAAYRALVIVNDRADIARLALAGGVHVGQDDLSPAAVRPLVGRSVAVGLSTHTGAQLGAALNEPIDYVAIGPVFGTATKDTGYEPVGLTSVADAADRTAARPLPLVAIGGITLDRASDVIRAGADAVAVISDLLATGDPATRVREYLAALD
jgi:thiamine-phosphate pyrophosphorylase